MTADKALHPTLAAGERRQLLLTGIELFNRQQFFTCHEAFETIWRSTTPEPRDLFQGLIQVAVGLFHYRERHRSDVARRVLAKGRRRLLPLAPTACGIDLELLLDDARLWDIWLEKPTPPEPAWPRLKLLDTRQAR